MGAAALSGILLVVLMAPGTPADCLDTEAPCHETLTDTIGEATACVDCVVDEATRPVHDITDAPRSETG